MEPLPWHEEIWRRLQARRTHDRFPHALLLAGPTGLGKGSFAALLGQGLLCGRPDERGLPCGVCHGCRVFAAQSHPDFRRVRPEESGKAIRVDQIRSLCEFMALTAQFGGRKVALLEPADRMNMAAANALLKTLEEPTAHAVLMLVTARPAALPATIRSRCQKIVFAPPPRTQAEAWLQSHTDACDPEILLAITGGAPCAALALAQGEGLEQRRNLVQQLVAIAGGKADPVAVAAGCKREEAEATCRWMLSYVTDMIRLKAAKRPPALRNPDLEEALRGLAGNMDLPALFSRLDGLSVAWHLSQQAQMNKQLLTEELFAAWAPESLALEGAW